MDVVMDDVISVQYLIVKMNHKTVGMTDQVPVSYCANQTAWSAAFWES